MTLNEQSKRIEAIGAIVNKRNDKNEIPSIEVKVERMKQAAKDFRLSKKKHDVIAYSILKVHKNGIY